MAQTRREFVTRSAAVGGALWATPAISTVSGAWAQSGSVACDNEACPGRGFGASLTAPVVGTLTLAETTSGPQQVVGVPAPLAASVIGADVGGPPCFARAHVDELTVTVVPSLRIDQGTLTASVDTNPDCTATSHSSITNVYVNNNKLADGEASPNSKFTVSVPLVGTTVVIVNEQGSSCRDGVEKHFVNALHATFTPTGSSVPTIELIIAHAEVGTTCCSC